MDGWPNPQANCYDPFNELNEVNLGGSGGPEIDTRSHTQMAHAVTKHKHIHG